MIHTLLDRAEPDLQELEAAYRAHYLKADSGQTVLVLFLLQLQISLFPNRLYSIPAEPGDTPRGAEYSSNPLPGELMFRVCYSPYYTALYLPDERYTSGKEYSMFITLGQR